MSARRLLLAALALVGSRALAAALGLDGCVSVLSGTPPPGGLSLEVGALAAVLVVLLQLAAVLVAPTLLIAAAIQGAAPTLSALARRLAKRRTASR